MNSVPFLLVTLLAGSFCLRTHAQVQDVAWQAKVNTVAGHNPSSGSSLTRTAGSAGWNADAASSQFISGDGFIEFRFDQTNKRMAAGLAYANSGSTYTTLDYGIVANSSTANALAAGSLFIRENGVNVTGIGTFAVSDVFRIERAGTLVKYYKNGALLRTATAQSLGALLMDTSFYDLQGSISGCKVQSNRWEEDVLWDRVTGGTASYLAPDQGSKFTHSATANVWEGAIGRKRIAADRYVKFRFTNTARQMAIGLSAANPNSVSASISHRIEATGATNSLQVLDPAGSLVSSTFAVTDIFTIKRQGSAVKYYKNDVLLATSTVALSGPVFVAASTYSAGASLDGCRFSGWTDEPVGWSNLTGAVASFAVDGVNTLSKSAGTVAWDAGAFGAKAIQRAGSVSFSFSQTDKLMVTGLSLTDGGASQTTIQLGVQALGNGTARVIESSVLIGTAVAYVPTDIFTIRRAAHAVSYEKNGVAFHQHSLTGLLAAAPLFVDTAFYHTGAQVQGIQVTGTAEDVLWRDMSSAAAATYNPGFGSRLYKSGTTAAWNTGAVSVQRMIRDGILQVRPEQTNKVFRIGLGYDDTGVLGDFAFALVFDTTGICTIFESGVSTGVTTPYLSTDIFRIERAGVWIRYYKGNTPLRTTYNASIPPLFADSAFYSGGPLNALANAQIYLATDNSDADQFLDTWENTYFGSLDPTAQGGGPGFESDYDRDGISNAQEYVSGTSPSDYYVGVLPDLRIVSGDTQVTDPSAVAPLPLSIEVRDDASPTAPLLADAPVFFQVWSAVNGDEGGISLLPTGPFSSVISTRSNTLNGQAAVWFQQPDTQGTTNTVRVTAYSGANSISKAFNISTYYLSAYWKFDDGAGPNVYDSSPFDPLAEGALQGSPARVEDLGASGTYFANQFALSLNGINQFVSVEDSDKLHFDQNGASFSVSAWIRIPKNVSLPLATSTDIYPIVSKWSSTGTGFDLSLKGGPGNGLSFRFYANGLVTSELVATTDKRTILTDGFPHLLAFTRDHASGGKLYFDGVLVGQLDGLTTSLTNADPIWLGRNFSNRYFRGVLDEVKLYASTVPASELLAARQLFDSDSDGLPDTWELRYFGTLVNTAQGDNDIGGADALNNQQEYLLGTKPTVRDTDGDGVTDGEEVTAGMNPLAYPMENSGLSLTIYTPWD